MSKLLDGKWEPTQYIADIRKQVNRLDSVMRSYEKQRSELLLEIERAARFMTDNPVMAPAEVRTIVEPIEAK